MSGPRLGALPIIVDLGVYISEWFFLFKSTWLHELVVKIFLIFLIAKTWLSHTVIIVNMFLFREATPSKNKNNMREVEKGERSRFSRKDKYGHTRVTWPFTEWARPFMEIHVSSPPAAPFPLGCQEGVRRLHLMRRRASKQHQPWFLFVRFASWSFFYNPFSSSYVSFIYINIWGEVLEVVVQGFRVAARCWEAWHFVGPGPLILLCWELMLMLMSDLTCPPWAFSCLISGDAWKRKNKKSSGVPCNAWQQNDDSLFMSCTSTNKKIVLNPHASSSFSIKKCIQWNILNSNNTFSKSIG